MHINYRNQHQKHTKPNVRFTKAMGQNGNFWRNLTHSSTCSVTIWSPLSRDRIATEIWTLRYSGYSSSLLTWPGALFRSRDLIPSLEQTLLLQSIGLKTRHSQISTVWTVATLGGTAQGDTLQGGDTQRKKSWANLQRIVDKWGRTGKKRCGVTPSREVTHEWNQEKWYRSDEQKKVVSFSAKIGVTPSVAAPGDTHSSDATECRQLNTVISVVS